MGQQPNDQNPERERPPQDASERERRDSVRRYVLGELSEEGMEQVEKRLISRDDYFEELLIAEEELADDFAGERLTGPALTKFRSHFLSAPELRQEVRFAKALRRRAAEHAQRHAPRPDDERPPPFLARFLSLFRQPAVGYALAAALLLAVCAAAWMVAQNRRLRAQVEQLQARQTPPQTPTATPTTTPPTELLERLASERERGDELATRLSREQEQRAEAERRLEEATRQQARPRRDQSAGSVVAAVVTLTPGIIRGEGGGFERVSLPPGGGRVPMRLDLAEDEYRSYRATLKTLDGKELLSTSNLRARAGSGGKAVPFSIPASSLAPGNDYQILLSGKSPNGAYEDVGTYYFRLVK